MFISCPNKCGVNNVEELEDHLLICLNGFYECPNKINGCESKPMKKQNLLNHIQKYCTYLECKQCGVNFNQSNYLKHVYCHEFGCLIENCQGCKELIKGSPTSTNNNTFDNNIHIHGCILNLINSYDFKNLKTLYLVDEFIGEYNIGSITKYVHLLNGFNEKLKPGFLCEGIKSLHLYDIKQDSLISNIPRSVNHLLLKLKPYMSIVKKNEDSFFTFDTKQEHIIELIPNIKNLFLKDGFNQILTSRIVLKEGMWIVFTRIKTKTSDSIEKINNLPSLLNILNI
ncbi:hypothetical protein ACTFIR_002332 [Dictyostelium discoideum]